MHSSRMRTGRSLTVCCSLLPGGGVPGLWGGCAWSPGGCLVPGGGVPGPGEGGGGVPGPGCLVWGGGVPGPGGICSGGVCAWSRGGIPACTEADTLPPPVDRILDTRL